MESQKEKIICIFNQKKEKPSKQIGKAFEIYLKETTKIKDGFGKNNNKC